MSDDEGLGTAALVFIGLIVVIVLLSVGGWALGWWFKGQDSQLQWQTDRNSGAYQQGHTDALSNEILDLSKITGQIAAADPTQAPLLKAQRAAEAQIACRNAEAITQPDPDIATWRSQNCVSGALAPTSVYNN